MTNEDDTSKEALGFKSMSEASRKAALDVFGALLMESRDTAIVQWDQILSGKRKYAPWERLRSRVPNLDNQLREVVGAVLPHIVDSFLYCLLSDLEASQSVRVATRVGTEVVQDVARASDGLPAEPTGENGWLERFSKQRFEQPY